MLHYEELKKKIGDGWNTWNTASVLSHVLLPEGFSINLGLKDFATGQVVRDLLIGRFGEREENIHPGIRSYDGTYTELTITLNDIQLKVESAVRDGEQYLLVTPLKQGICAPILFVEAAFLWNKPGTVYRKEEVLYGVAENRTLSVHVTGLPKREPHLQLKNPYVTLSLEQPVAISTSAVISIEQAAAVMAEARADVLASADGYGTLAEAYQAMRSCLAWDTIYEPEYGQICSPVSRLWNLHWGGYVLFCWDTFFAAAMMSLENKELAYSNVFAILNEITESGFVPNFGAANDNKSRDRSQPPVGSMVVLDIYRRHRERWFVEETFDRLADWNQWFFEHRRSDCGTLCWGSNTYKPRIGRNWEYEGVHDRFGAALESGLDNSPMYDDIPFDAQKNILKLSDAGLSGLFIHDCECLVELAHILGKDPSEFERRKAVVHAGLADLWEDDFGLYLNRRTDTGEFSYRISPTNFYALFDKEQPKEQADRAVQEHFYNETEFWGDYILPSIARNDPAYPDQDYWRGRIWAPMNYLAYEALRSAGQTQACKDLADKSRELILKEWRLHGHVHENYDGDTGMGCGVHNSDKFYHWGGLLAYIAILNEGNEE